MQIRQDLVELLDAAQKAARYDDMVGYAKQLCSCADEYSPLNNIERKFVVTAYKNAISGIRTALRALAELEPREEKKSQLPNGNPRLIMAFRSYKSKLENQVLQYCNEFVQLTDQILAYTQVKQSEEQKERDQVKEQKEQSKGSDQRIFFLKSQADFQRYMCECQSGSQRENTTELTQQLYEQTYLAAKQELKPSHPTRLGLALNYSVFLYEMLDDVSSAIQVARESSELAINEIETLDDATHSQVTNLLFQLRDNLTEWNQEWEAIENQDDK